MFWRTRLRGPPVNPQAYERAVAEAQGFSDEKLRRLLHEGPEGLEPDAWRVLTDECDRREAQASGPSEIPWGTIGFGKGGELGMGIAMGFALVGLLVGLIVGPVRLVSASP
jgi:hypothetical protein